MITTKNNVRTKKILLSFFHNLFKQSLQEKPTWLLFTWSDKTESKIDEAKKAAS